MQFKQKFIVTSLQHRCAIARSLDGAVEVYIPGREMDRLRLYHGQSIEAVILPPTAPGRLPIAGDVCIA